MDNAPDLRHARRRLKGMTVMKAKDANLLQTLRRGMDAVSLIAQAPEGLSIAEIAARLGVNRAIAYRIVATLDSDGFVTRGDGGRIFLGGAVLRDFSFAMI